MLAYIDQRAFLVMQLEPDLADIPRVLAPSVLEILDSHLGDCRSLFSGQSAEIKNRVAIRTNVHVVAHVREPQQRQFAKHHILRYLGSLGAPGLCFRHSFRHLSIA